MKEPLGEGVAMHAGPESCGLAWAGAERRYRKRRTVNLLSRPPIALPIRGCDERYGQISAEEEVTLDAAERLAWQAAGCSGGQGEPVTQTRY